MLLSLFCGAGGLDLGFEQSGFEIAIACDIRKDSVRSYNHNRKKTGQAFGHCLNVRELTLQKLDEIHGAEFHPTGIIGGPPCQSFSRANKSQTSDDPRHELPFVYAQIIESLNNRHPVPFFMFENVTGLNEEPHRERFLELKTRLDSIGFTVTETTLNATTFGVPQSRSRLILVGLNKTIFNGKAWEPPHPTIPKSKWRTVRQAFHGLPEPTFFRNGLKPKDIPHHVNHWCMTPKSKKFFIQGALTEGDSSNRSFKTLGWDKPSITVAYGHREVHIHPNCHRRLSVFEAMLLQGFPQSYELIGTLSSQITQVSEAVPPPMAKAIADAIKSQMAAFRTTNGEDGAMPRRSPRKISLFPAKSLSQT